MTATTDWHLAAELARRETAGDDDASPLYLVIFNGGRGRLRFGEWRHPWFGFESLFARRRREPNDR